MKNCLKKVLPFLILEQYQACNTTTSRNKAFLFAGSVNKPYIKPVTSLIQDVVGQVLMMKYLNQLKEFLMQMADVSKLFVQTVTVTWGMSLKESN